MRIAVIADTHDRVPPVLLRKLRSAEEIWHLGDVCEPTTLALIESLGIPVHVVLGNNEWHNFWPFDLRLERGGRRFFLTHISPGRTPEKVDVVLHGHTHVPRDETDEAGVRWLNPGCITRPSRGARASFAWLTVEDGKPLEWRLELV